MARSRKKAPARRSVSRAAETEWAFHATNASVFRALARGRHSGSLREYFGTQPFEELTALARAATNAKRKGGPRILIVPGMMGSRLSDVGRGGAPARVLWIDPRRIAAGHLTNLKLPSARSIRPRGVMLPSYAKLKLRLAIEGFAADFFAYDWRLGIDAIGARLAASIAAAGEPTVLIAHSMGALVARIAVKQIAKRLVRKLIMLGAPNRGAFAPVLALRGTYPFVRKLSRLDLRHSADHLAAHVFCTFPGLYQMLPPDRADLAVDLLDARGWPSSGPQPDAALLGRVAEVRAAMAAPDARMVQIVGVNRETVVSVRRTAAGFEYGSSMNGDGTVPVSLALLPGLEAYFADEAHGNLANNSLVIDALIDLVRTGRTRALSQRFEPGQGALSQVDDAQLRSMVDDGKIDWRRLDSAQREAALAELEGVREEDQIGSAQSLA
jgi:pimeloyl-ACP methyl ester carboxylesterase